jgi:hypothetical protein
MVGSRNLGCKIGSHHDGLSVAPRFGVQHALLVRQLRVRGKALDVSGREAKKCVKNSDEMVSWGEEGLWATGWASCSVVTAASESPAALRSTAVVRNDVRCVTKQRAQHAPWRTTSEASLGTAVEARRAYLTALDFSPAHEQPVRGEDGVGEGRGATEFVVHDGKAAQSSGVLGLELDARPKERPSLLLALHDIRAVRGPRAKGRQAPGSTGVLPRAA